jgi:D-alanyl-D-alanine carboxypeptidase/D-alanyl-D-alanine-endopeptidase (penicillin-binding protein 4)
MLCLLLFLLIVNGISAQEACDGCGFYAVHIETGEVRAAGDFDHALIPASTWKVVTVLSVIDRLGEGANFASGLYIDGNVDRHGVLWGNVVLRPDRDPTWYSRHLQGGKDRILEELSAAISDEGISCIAGRVIIDLSHMGSDVLAPTWPWEDLGNYYATGAWGLNYRDNTVKLHFRKGEEAPVLASVIPEFEDVEWINELQFGRPGSGDQAYVHAAPGQRLRYIRGTLPKDMTEMTIKGAMPDPVALFLEDWSEVLKSTGVELEELLIVFESDLVNKKMRLIHEIHTPLSKVARIALKESDNLYTEALFRKAFPGMTYKASLVSFESFLMEKGWSTIPKDGAGLSTALRWSPEESVRMLRDFLVDEPGYAVYLPPVAQTSLGGFVPKSNMTRLKSGSMSDVTTYLGLWEGEWVFFVGHNGREPGRNEVRRHMVEWLMSLPLSRKY